MSQTHALILKFGFVTLALMMSAHAMASPYGDPCPPEAFETCYESKSARFVPPIDPADRGQPYERVKLACEAGDADGCFMVANFLRRDHRNAGNSSVDLAAPVDKATPFDLQRGLEAYQRACELKSALACATYAYERIEDAGGTFETAPPAVQFEALNYQKRSCLLGWGLSCEVYLDDVRTVEDEASWPVSFASLHDDEYDVAMELCRAGDQLGCHQAAVALLMKASHPEGTDAEGYKGARLLVQSCEAGEPASCDLCSRTGDLCDPETWPE